jgi:hypothetical protein
MILTKAAYHSKYYTEHNDATIALIQKVHIFI